MRRFCVLLHLMALIVLPLASRGASPKLGWAGSDIDHVNGSNASWYYNWWHTRPAGDANANGDWIPLIKYTNNWQSKLDLVASYTDVDALLVLNEPEREEQSNVTVTEAISLWPQVQQTLPNHTLVSPAVSDNAQGQAWLSSFMSQVDTRNNNANPSDDLRVDAIAFHWYGGSNPNNPVGAANSFLSRVDHYYNTYDRPVWITEFAMHDWEGDDTDAEMQEANRIFLETVIPALESRSYVHAYSFYHHFSDARLLDGSSVVTPTAIGDVYVDTLHTGDSRNLNGVSLGTDVTYLRGGTVTNTGAALASAMRGIDAIEGASTIAGSGAWGVVGANSFVRVRSGATLSKTGTNTITFDGADIDNQGTININAGTLHLANTQLASSGLVRVNAAGTLSLALSRSPFTTVGQSLEVAGTIAGSATLTANSRLVTLTSGASATGSLTFNNSSLIVGGTGFSESMPTVLPITTGLDLHFDAAQDTPGDQAWTNLTGGDSVSFGGAVSPTAAADAAFPALTAAYAIPTTGGAQGLNGYFDAVGPRSARDATFEVLFRVANQSGAADQVLFEAGGVDRGVALTLSGNQLLFNVDGIATDNNLTHTLANGWHHAVGVVDLSASGDQVHLYIDGVQVGSLAGLTIGDWAGGNLTGIGAGASSVTGVAAGVGTAYHSSVALLRYYNNVAFNSTQVAQNYQSLTSAPTPLGSVFSIGTDLIVQTGSSVELDLGDHLQSDKIVIGQALALSGGTLKLAYVGTNGLAAGQVFDLFDFTVAVGSFSQFVLPTLAAGTMWNIDSLMIDGTIAVTLAGDYSGDGVVDTADYTLWRDALGQAVTAWTGADGNGDGMVTVLDRDVWAAAFGQQVTMASLVSVQTVPEPKAWLLAGLLILVVARRLIGPSDRGFGATA